MEAPPFKLTPDTTFDEMLESHSRKFEIGAFNLDSDNYSSWE